MQQLVVVVVLFCFRVDGRRHMMVVFLHGYVLCGVVCLPRGVGELKIWLWVGFVGVLLGVWGSVCSVLCLVPPVWGWCCVRTV